MRSACVDIGSNTTRLLVAERDGRRLRVVCEDRTFTHIGADLIAADTISPERCEEVLAVVTRQLALADEHGAASVQGVATAAIRRAANGISLVREIRARTGLDVLVLSDREEARLAFLGAAGMAAADEVDGDAVDGESAALGVLDVGGGSSEVVIGRAPATVDWWASLAIGSGTLTARCLTGDPPGASELARARAEVRAATSRLGWMAPAPALTLAVGGSATSLRRLCGERLTADALADALADLCAVPAAVVAERFGIDPRRARLLPAGLLILQGLAGEVGGQLVVGRGGIREGVLLEALAP